MQFIVCIKPELAIQLICIVLRLRHRQRKIINVVIDVVGYRQCAVHGIVNSETTHLNGRTSPDEYAARTMSPVLTC